MEAAAVPGGLVSQNVFVNGEIAQMKRPLDGTQWNDRAGSETEDRDPLGLEGIPQGPNMGMEELGQLIELDHLPVAGFKVMNGHGLHVQ